MKFWVDCLDGREPKRGDIIHTNVGDRRERTCFILRTRRVNRIVRSSRELVPRFNLWCERWWQLEPDLRMRLFRSAERSGGQQVFMFKRYPAKKKRKTIQEWL